MAYAAVVSVRHTIYQLYRGCRVSTQEEVIYSAYNELDSLEEVLERLDSCSSNDRVDALDGQIRDTVYEFEDVLESHVSQQIASRPPSRFSVDLEEVVQAIGSFTQSVKELKEEYADALTEEEEDGDDDFAPPITDAGETESVMVGFSDLFRTIIKYLSGYDDEQKMYVMIGMAGIGKTLLAKRVFKNKFLSQHFDHRVWITVGPKKQLKQVLQTVLARINCEIGNNAPTQGDDASSDSDLESMITETLKRKRFLIVVDDNWDEEVRKMFERILVGNSNTSKILLTTRQGYKEWCTSNFVDEYWMSLLNEDESWELLCKKVFRGQGGVCPHELTKAGKMIAENCDGLPLTIVTVADLLLKADNMTPEYWNKAAEIKNPIYRDAYDQMLEVLYPSYHHLSQFLKASFLYMGVFPLKYVIPCSKLDMMLGAEEIRSSILYNGVYVLYLVRSTVVMDIQWCSGSSKIKTCRLHSSFWHLCSREAERIKFFYILNNLEGGLAESTKNQRRLCIHNNILLGIKDVRDSIATNSVVRSFLCTGRDHPYPVPICFNMGLLKLLDVLAIHFYEFPMEVLDLIMLRYLTLTSNGNIPDLIFKLRDLRVLIMRRRLSIKMVGDKPHRLPVEIWDMKNLEHLQITGSILPDPCGDLPLYMLQVLLDVGAHGCTKRVVERLPNLKTLGIRVELEPCNVEPLRCFDHISHLENLESFKCVIVNPVLGCDEVITPSPPLIFPWRLKKLTLCGFGYPWDNMKVIASLLCLQVLKLRCYAFRGLKWETRDYGFRALHFLLIEDCDLAHWTIEDSCFTQLQRLKMKHCYRLKEIPTEFSYSLKSIELVDCNPSVANQFYGNRYHFRVHVSSDDGDLIT